MLVRAIDSTTSDNRVESGDQLQVGVLQEGLKIPIRVGDAPLAVEEPRGPRDLLCRRHPKMVPPNKRSV